MTAQNSHSFALLAYGESPYLDECIQSLKRQTVAGEIFIATSTPSAFIDRVAAAHGIGVKVHERSRGIASDWSFALANAPTNYVTLAHQDDLYLPGYAAACLARLAGRRDCAIVCTDYSELINGRYRRYHVNFAVKKLLLLPFLFRPAVSAPFLKRAVLSLGNPICCPSVMYNREALGAFAFSDDFTFNIDWDAWLRIAARDTAVAYINRRLVVHRIHAASHTTRCIADGKRALEERILFGRLWPAPLARIIAAVYALGAEANDEEK